METQIKRILLLIALAIASFGAWAKPDTVTLSVPGMNCAVCPITVRKALEQVDGVALAKVDYDTKTAVVTFDDQSTSVQKLREATSNVGYPSHLVKTDEANGQS